MKLWIARNKSKVIKLFTIEPEYNNISDEWKGYDFEEIELNVLNFTEVTFENSPMQVELKLVEDIVNIEEYNIKAVPCIDIKY